MRIVKNFLVFEKNLFKKMYVEKHLNIVGGVFLKYASVGYKNKINNLLVVQNTHKFTLFL